MKTWCVYHFIHVHTPYRYIPKLIITGVPEGETVTKDLLSRAGYQYQEFGLPWANHAVTQVDPQESPADLQEITWAELLNRATTPLNAEDETPIEQLVRVVSLLGLGTFELNMADTDGTARLTWEKDGIGCGTQFHRRSVDRLLVITQ
jgi:hypothetical protein